MARFIAAAFIKIISTLRQTCRKGEHLRKAPKKPGFVGAYVSALI